MTGALKLAGLLTVLALGAGLPIILAGSPCLSETSTSNDFGGHLGTFTDMSILRLLNALDPDPQSARGGLATRGLPSTIHSALGSARTRLIMLSVIISLLGCGGGLFVIWQTHRTLVAGYEEFNKDRQNTDMGIIPYEAAPSWKGLSSEVIRRWLESRVGSESQKDVWVKGVFGIPSVESLKRLIEERDKVLNQLEEAEARYISVFRLVETSDGPRLRVGDTRQDEGLETVQDFVAPKAFYLLPRSAKFVNGPFNVNMPSGSTEAPHSDDPRRLSRFREVSHDSLLCGGPFVMGQRVKVNELGRWVTDPSPTSQYSPSSAYEDPPDTPTGQAETHSSIPTNDLPQHRSVIGQVYEDIRVQRAQLKVLNDAIVHEQNDCRLRARSGNSVVGWVVVGSGMKDIIWENVGKKSGETIFWLQVALVAMLLAALMVPFIGLSLGSAPGFAHYLGFLGSLSRSDGFGSGFAQSAVPTILLTLAVLSAVLSVNYLSRRIKTVSITRQKMLAYKAVFNLLLFTTLFWLVTVTALEFAVEGFATDSEEDRAVGDGAVFSTWLVFIVLLNVAIVVPGLVLLQPLHLWKHWRKPESRQTPRQRYRERISSSFNLTLVAAPFLVAVFYGLSLLFLFPLLSLPLVLLLYLLLIAHRYMVDHVFIEKIGYGGGKLAIWTVRRLGWVLGVQPFLFGLVLLSRREWDIGGAGVGVGVMTVALAEVLTHRRHEKKRELERLFEQASTKKFDKDKGRVFTYPPSSESLLDRIGSVIIHERMPTIESVPYTTEDLPDQVYTERASWTRSDLPAEDPHRPRLYFYDPTERMRGLVYPPEILAPPPVVWLPWDNGGVSAEESYNLQRYHGLNATIDPPPNGHGLPLEASWSSGPGSSVSATHL